MSRRPMQRTASSEAIFAKRRGEIPFQIYFEISNIGRTVESSKKRARWMFCFGDEGQEHEVALVHSVMSGKKKTLFNGELINEAQKVSAEWSFAWSYGAHLLRVGINFDEYSLVIDGIPFSSFSRRDPYLAAQLEATKRDSMRSLRSDEQRRFEKLGYDSGGAGRSRTTERKRPSAGSTGSRRSSSKESAPPRRSDSDERRTGDRARPVVTRASSARQLKSPPNPSGPGEQRGKSKAGKPSGQSNGGRFDGHGGSGRGASGGENSTGDILSADPSSLEVNPFNAQVSEADFDPLASRQGTARGVENGTGNQMRGARSGGGNGFVGTGQQDADAVLRIGMQFKTMEVSQQFQQQQQQQQYQSPFDHTAYQQYDESGFPQQMPQQVYTAPPQPQVAERVVFGRAPQVASKVFGGPSGDGVFGFSDSYDAHEQHEQHRHQQQQQQRSAEVHRMSGQRSVSSDATDSKASLDPWELARGGMVNIDDITGTKHLPPVEVKPFTNDHRPLADLVRETPSKPRVSVMMERPEPAPTHMAVAIVPVQPPRQQQAVHAQGSFPHQQNGNPFARLALTQYGQPAQPILYTKPDDPFHNL